MSTNEVITERESRLQEELARYTEAELATPCYDLNAEELLRELASEAGFWSARSALNDANLWDLTLGQAVTYLVDDIYTRDGETYDSLDELQAAIDAEPVAIRVIDVRFGSGQATVTVCDVDRRGREDCYEDVTVTHGYCDSRTEIWQAIDSKLESIAKRRDLELI